MNYINQTIIDAIIKKAKIICPNSLAVIGIYGSVATGDEYEKSDLDLMILINDDGGWKLGTGFILDDIAVGYDLYCTNWAMIEGDAECNHAHLSKLMDSKIVYVKDENAIKKLNELKSKVTNLLYSEERYEKAEAALKNAKIAYADTMLVNTLGQVRTDASIVINYLLDAVMLFNSKYFKRGVKRTFDELEQISLPEHFVSLIHGIAVASETNEIRQCLTELLTSTQNYIKRENDKEPPSAGNLSGSYEEMFSNWQNKMLEASDRRDVFASFMNLTSLQLVIHEMADEVAIEDFNFMDEYNPSDLGGNVAVYDEALSRYLVEYKKAGIIAKHYSDVDEFVQNYLK